MTTINTPDAVPNELIPASWGDAVRGDLQRLNTTKVEASGDSMTGMLLLPGTNPTNANHAARKGYVDAQVATSVRDNVEGGQTMKGSLTAPNMFVTANPPSGNVNAVVPRQEMNAAIAGRISRKGDHMEGALTGPEPNGPNQYTIKSYVDAEDAKNLPKGGGTISGGLTIQNNLTVQNAAAIQGTLTMGGNINMGGHDVTNESDYRLKEKLGPITDAAERVRLLGSAAYRGRWRNDGEVEWDLLNAHAIAAVAPYAVEGDLDGDEMQSVRFRALIPLLFAALSNALDRIAVLEGQRLMPWPPTIYPPDRVNETENINRHPGDHNEISKAITELINKVNVNTTGLVGKLNLTGGTLTGKLTLTDTGDVSLASTGHPFQIGASNAANIAMDSNEIQARINGAASGLTLNQGGGAVNASGVTLNDGGMTVPGGMNVGGNRIRLYEDGSMLVGQSATINGSLSTGGNFTAEGWATADYFSTIGRVISGPSGAPTTNYGAHLSPSGYFRATTNSTSLGSIVLNRAGNAADAGQRFLSMFRGVPWGAETNCGSIRIVSASTVAFDTTSDKRLKTQTNNASDASDVVSVLGSKVYRGVWTADEGQGEEWFFLNSQDAEPLVPFAVHGPADGDVNADPQQMDHSALVPLLLAAVSQLTARVAELEAA